jgi:hypothetical protein
VVALFQVSFDFTSSRTVWLDITKPFRFRLGDEPWRDCDPTALPSGGVTGDTGFVRLVGRTCVHAVLTEEELVLTFSEGGALQVDLKEDDFEPVHLRGTGLGADDFFWTLLGGSGPQASRATAQPGPSPLLSKPQPATGASVEGQDRTAASSSLRIHGYAGAFRG